MRKRRKAGPGDAYDLPEVIVRIRLAIAHESVRIMRHASERIIERGVPFYLIESAINAGRLKVVEVQPDDPRGPVFRIRCRTSRGPVDCAFGVDEFEVRLVTVFIP